MLTQLGFFLQTHLQLRLRMQEEKRLQNGGPGNNGDRMNEIFNDMNNVETWKETHSCSPDVSVRRDSSHMSIAGCVRIRLRFQLPGNKCTYLQYDKLTLGVVRPRCRSVQELHKWRKRKEKRRWKKLKRWLTFSVSVTLEESKSLAFQHVCQLVWVQPAYIQFTSSLTTWISSLTGVTQSSCWVRVCVCVCVVGLNLSP